MPAILFIYTYIIDVVMSFMAPASPKATPWPEDGMRGGETKGRRHIYVHIVKQNFYSGQEYVNLLRH